jgi:hypothetical protein
MTTYPKWVYHKEHAPEGLLVHSEADEPKGDGWVSTPALFDPNYVLPPQLSPEAQAEQGARGGRPFVAYPAWRYAEGEEPVLVATAEADEKLDKAKWKDTPVVTPLPTTPPARPSVSFPEKKAKDKE